MGDFLEELGFHPLTPEQERAAKEYETHMQEVVIPKLEQQDFENRQRAVGARRWVLTR